MSFTKAQRMQLEELSFKAYGNPTAWQRVYKNARVPEDTYTRKNRPRYLTLKNGQIVKASTAKNKGWLGQDEQTHEDKPTPVFRNATYEELADAMRSQIEKNTLASLEDEDMMTYAVFNFFEGTLLNQPYLVVDEKQKDDFEVLLQEEEVASFAEKLRALVTSHNNPKEFCLDGPSFVRELIQVELDPDAYEKKVEALFNVSEESY